MERGTIRGRTASARACLGLACEVQEARGRKRGGGFVLRMSKAGRWRAGGGQVGGGGSWMHSGPVKAVPSWMHVPRHSWDCTFLNR